MKECMNTMWDGIIIKNSYSQIGIKLLPTGPYRSKVVKSFFLNEVSNMLWNKQIIRLGCHNECDPINTLTCGKNGKS